MTHIPTEAEGDYTPDRIEFWLEEARLLEETASLSWNADARVREQAKLLYSPQHDHVLRHATEELGAELNLLYRYLISLAIQYLAIGILIDRDASYFLQQQPGHRILTLVQACGVQTSAQQQRLLQDVESAYDWADRYPFGELGDGHDELRQMTHRLSEMECLSREEKVTLDELYATLRAMAQQRAA